MKRLILIAAVVLLAVITLGALGGNLVQWNSNTYTYLSPGGCLAGLRDTSDAITFPENVRSVTFWILADSGAANADDDSIFYVLYGVSPYGTYVYLDSITKGAYADNAVESTGCRVNRPDTFWHYHTFQLDTVTNPSGLRIYGQGWIDQFSEFRLIMRATDTSDLGSSVRITYTTYPTTGFIPY